MASLTYSSSPAQSNHPTELRIVLIGGRESNGGLKGKSSAGNFILGQNVFNTSRRTAQSEARQQEVFSRRVTVVDTPGWCWVYPREDTPKLDQIEIQNSVHLCPPGPHVFLLVIPVSLYLPELVKASLKQHLELLNADVFKIWKHTLVLFTYGDWLGVKTVEERIESDEGLQWIVNKCENRYHVLNNKDHSDKTQVKELLEKIEEMWAGNEDPYYEVELDRAFQHDSVEEGNHVCCLNRNILLFNSQRVGFWYVFQNIYIVCLLYMISEPTRSERKCKMCET
uniref:AIG1-type G domain-containing protein n=1 Tax=Poecilia latipinna TaxID=48699 RepID=A0A3B3UQA1_9TELE